MDPVSLRMAAQLVGTLLQSKTLRTIVVGVLAFIVMLASLMVATPLLIAQSLLGAGRAQAFGPVGGDGARPDHRRAGAPAS